ncbi:MAG: hypothetical protein JNM56_17655 [Planctomycetia bacterium]|nr:hypothetical protein [Planctomycetia bacterium]
MKRCAIGLLLMVAGWEHGARAGEPAADDPCHTMARAGYPQEVSCFARPSDTGAYIGYQVGGGSPFRKNSYGPAPDAGTWGWDYQGWCFARKVVLRWWAKPHYQGGTGAYKTEGPRLRGEAHGLE